MGFPMVQCTEKDLQVQSPSPPVTFVQGFVLIVAIHAGLRQNSAGRVKRSEEERIGSRGEVYQPCL
jgi:hypothetical protein